MAEIEEGFRLNRFDKNQIERAADQAATNGSVVRLLVGDAEGNRYRILVERASNKEQMLAERLARGN